MPPYPWPGTGITLAAVDFPVLMVPARSSISPSSLQDHIGALVSAARKPLDALWQGFYKSFGFA